VSDQREFVVAECLRETDDIGGEFAHVVRLDLTWRAAAAVAALIRHRDPETGVHDRIDLVPP
tara:strand:+ start:1501 stop:1686 length:186 start_codon:yes stop_codon:yes gene_type:complete